MLVHLIHRFGACGRAANFVHQASKPQKITATMPSATGKQLTLFITFKIQPDRIKEWKDAHRPVLAATAAEPRQLFFDCFHDASDPGTFRFVEVWDGDREWFEKEQFTKDYYKPLWPKSQPTWREPIQVEYFERMGDDAFAELSYRKGFLNLGRLME